MFAHFCEALLSGAFALYGADVHGHVATLRAQKVSRPDGSTVYQHALGGRVPPAALADGDRLHRSWRCRKAGFWRALGLESWVHDEVMVRVGDTLVVTDRTTWHGGKSVAQRKYAAEADPAGALLLRKGRWSIQMGGLLWPVRGRVEAAMRRALPDAADAAVDRFLERHALPPP